MAKRRGLTLLELILALGLSGLILYAVAMAIDLHLRVLDVRRTNVEEAQVARAVLHMIATDLRSTVKQYRMDMSAVEQMAAGAFGELVGGGAGGGENGGGENGGGGGGTGEGGTGNGGGTGGSGTGTGTGSGTGTGTGSGEELTESAYTGDLVNSSALPPVLGLYGNQYELQLDISRLPRPDEYQVVTTVNDLSLPQIPSDVKTVTYYVQNMLSAGSGVEDPLRDRRQSAASTSAGLVRREVDRSVMQYALESGNVQALQRTGDLLAPEVTAIQFLYFDGYSWLNTWDSEQMQGLPVAVEIAIVITPRTRDGTYLTDAANQAVTAENIVYRLVVQLPQGKPAQETTTDSGMENLGL